MSYLNDFYKVISSEKTGNSFISAVFLDKQHPIFGGHFPDNPITPGVCMMQIVKELAESHLGSELHLNKVNSVKFAAIVNPFLTPNLRFELDIQPMEAGVKIKTLVYMEDTIALKAVEEFSISPVSDSK